MNAKMIITVPIEQIPKEVDKVLYQLSNRLMLLRQEAASLLNNNSSESKLYAIDELRKKLALIDLNYEDCYSILNGYEQYVNNANEQTHANNDINNNG